MSVLEVHYVGWLIAVSVGNSILAAYVALMLAERMRVARTAPERWSWLQAGSMALGSGIWAMHYLGMLAVQLPVAMYYYWPTVLLSGMLAVAASGVTLIVMSRDKAGREHLFVGSLMMATGIGLMHYVGMAAMRSRAMESYNPWVVALSVAAAAVLSWMALATAFAVRPKGFTGGLRLRLMGAVLMGVGIAAMHYIAMAGVTFYRMDTPVDYTGTIHVSRLGIWGVAVVTSLMLLGALVMAALDQRRMGALSAANRELVEVQRALYENELQLREAIAALNELAVRDGLTGLFNRRHFDAVFSVEWRRAGREHKSLALLLIDVDNFKAFNDRYGHLGGDECLRELARTLVGAPRRGYDCIARFGGEEFAVLLPGAKAEDAARIAEELRLRVLKLQLEHASSGVSQFATVSIGVSSRMPVAGEDSRVLVAEADAALYAAKRAGRNCVRTAGAVEQNEVLLGRAS
ncbi:MAG: diguanylate cyclase [Acidobacteriota bacterium]